MARGVWAAGLPRPDGSIGFVRGIGWSPWHATEHWHHSKATRDLDQKLLREAHIDGLRSWGVYPRRVAEANLRQGRSVWATVRFKPSVKSKFSNGTEGGIALAHPKNIDTFVGACREAAERFKGLSPALVLLLGNEYSYVGPCGKHYLYKGFDDYTQQDFRRWLQGRFGTIERFNTTCGTKCEGFEAVRPFANRRTKLEWWLYLHMTFERFMRAGYDTIKAVDPSRPVSYAKLMGNHWDPCTEYARLPFLDIGGDNLYWHWRKTWQDYNHYLNDLVAAAQGRPVIITESGFQSLVRGEEESARLMKQMLLNCMIHPQVAGVAVYAYSDEWYVDGKPQEQAKGESWGIVTADRKAKAQYQSVAEVYKLFEQENDFLVHRAAPAIVAVSTQDWDWLVTGKPYQFHISVERMLYANGVIFETVCSEDLCDIDPKRQPRLILCDDYFRNEPDGKPGALEGLLRYVQQGGRVLYFSDNPFKVAYGEAKVPAEVQSALKQAHGSPPSATVRLGEGSIVWVGSKKLALREIQQRCLPFLKAAQPAVRIDSLTVEPAQHRYDVFCRLLSTPTRRWLVAINCADKSLSSVSAVLRGVRAEDVKLLATDGGAHKHVASANGLVLTLSGLNTYAVLDIGARP